MERIKNIFWMLVAIGIIISVPLGLFYVGKTFFSFLATIDKTVAAAIIAASGTTFAAVFTVVIGQLINKQREIADAHREYKVKLYSEFIDFTIDWVFKNAENEQSLEDPEVMKELEKFFIKFSKELTLWASPSVINSWSAFRNGTGTGKATDTLIKVDSIFKAMRKDLGNSNFGLEESALIKLFLKNEEVTSNQPSNTDTENSTGS